MFSPNAISLYPAGHLRGSRTFFDDQADQQIDDLLRINFTQNMKSMEVYYRQVCLWYARQRGRIHRPLAETLFRYNRRPRLAGFLLNSF